VSNVGEGRPRRRRRRERGPTEEELLRKLEMVDKFMVECEACQAENPQHWQYCSECGARLATACPGCGCPLPPVGARYCPHCGMELPEAEPEA
jgi:predicted amidophosphoribosyltransferase